MSVIAADKTSTPPSLPRRVLLLGAVGSAALVGGGELIRQGLQATAESNLGAEGIVDTLVIFTGELFGRSLSRLDEQDLTERVRFLFAQGGAIADDCQRLALWVHNEARKHGVQAYRGCSDEQREAILAQVMRINWRSLPARVMSRLSADERAHYRMRWSAVPQLAWIYRHAAAAWRARGYRRWPGLAGDWREALVAGDVYPA